MVGCSIIPGLAGMYLCSRASTKHSLSTAGFLLCTWILGLVQTDGIQDMETRLLRGILFFFFFFCFAFLGSYDLTANLKPWA